MCFKRRCGLLEFPFVGDDRLRLSEPGKHRSVSWPFIERVSLIQIFFAYVSLVSIWRDAAHSLQCKTPLLVDRNQRSNLFLEFVKLATQQLFDVPPEFVVNDKPGTAHSAPPSHDRDGEIADDASFM